MRKNDGEKDNQHQGRPATLERVQKVRDRPRRRLVRHTREDDSGKGKEIGSWLPIYVHPLTVGKDHVIQYRKLFLDAVNWYSQALVERLTQPNTKHLVPYVNDPDYSLLLDLKKRVESGDEVPNGKMNNLLGTIVGEYHLHLRKLGAVSWIREDTVQRQMAQIDEITRDVLSKGKR